MSLYCWQCEKEIAEARVNAEAGVACCGGCGALWPVGDARPRSGAGEPAFHGPVDLRVDDRRLVMTYPLRPPGPGGWAALILFTLFGAIWWGVLISWGRSALGHETGPFGLFALLFSLPFYLAGLLELGVVLALLFGRATLVLEPSRAALTWAVWGIGWTRSTRLDGRTHCRWHARPWVQSTTRKAPVQRTRTDPPFLLTNGVDALGFGWPVPPERREALVQAINRFLDAQEPAGAFLIPRTAPVRLPGCPRCGQVLGPASVDVPAQRVQCPKCRESSALSLDSARVVAPVEPEEPAAPPAPRPEKTAIVIERPREGQMVIYCPPHGLRGTPRGLFVFGVLWTAFTLFMMVATFLGTRQGPREAALLSYLFPFLFTLGFVGIGVAMLYFALRAAYRRRILFLEKERIALRTILGRRQNDEAAVRQPGALAEQVVAYEQNDRPIYKIRLGGSKVSFGSELDPAEKDWLVSEINAFWRALDR